MRRSSLNDWQTLSQEQTTHQHWIWKNGCRSFLVHGMGHSSNERLGNGQDNFTFEEIRIMREEN